MNDFRLEVRLRKLFVLDFLGDYIVSIHFILTMVSILLLFRRIVYICRNAVSAIVLSQPFAFTLCYQNVNTIVLDIIFLYHRTCCDCDVRTSSTELM